MKLSRVVPTHTKSVEFYAIKKDFSHYTESWRLSRSKVRKPLDKCDWCQSPFKEGDTIALGFRHGAGNMVLCHTCADSAAPRDPGAPAGKV